MSIVTVRKFIFLLSVTAAMVGVMPYLCSFDFEHVPVGERELSQEEKQAAKIEATQREMRASESDSEEGELDKSSVRIAKEVIVGDVKCSEGQSDIGAKSKGFVHKDVQVHLTTHEGALHRPVSLSVFGDQVELEDGAVYCVRPKDRLKVLDWLSSDLILVVPPSFFSSYDYALINQSTGVRVEVNLLLGPIVNGMYTHWITAIDRENGKICLEDGSIWDVHLFDRGMVQRWLLGDTIILGFNDSWFANARPNILINVNLNEYIKSKCIY